MKFMKQAIMPIVLIVSIIAETSYVSKPGCQVFCNKEERHRKAAAEKKYYNAEENSFLNL